MFSPGSKNETINSATLNLTSPMPSNLVQSKILLFGKELTQFKAFTNEELTLYQMKKNDVVQIESICRQQLNIIQTIKFVLYIVKKIVGKAENDSYQGFLLF